MIVEKALSLAGRDAVLVGRPGRHVVHVYAGPLSPSQRCVPRGAGPVCRARTRRLYAVTPRPSGSLCAEVGEGTPRLCARCSARLEPLQADLAEQHPRTRDDWLGRYRSLTAFDLATDALMAETVAEVERCEHLTLLIVGFPACRDQVIDAYGMTLDQVLAKARTAVGGQHFDDWRAEAEAATRNQAVQIRKYERELARKVRDIGIHGRAGLDDREAG